MQNRGEILGATYKLYKFLNYAPSFRKSVCSTNTRRPDIQQWRNIDIQLGKAVLQPGCFFRIHKACIDTLIIIQFQESDLVIGKEPRYILEMRKQKEIQLRELTQDVVRRALVIKLSRLSSSDLLSDLFDSTTNSRSWHEESNMELQFFTEILPCRSNAWFRRLTVEMCRCPLPALYPIKVSLSEYSSKSKPRTVAAISESAQQQQEDEPSSTSHSDRELRRKQTAMLQRIDSIYSMRLRLLELSRNAILD